MAKTIKRIHTELKSILDENEKNPTSKKFLIDTTPFNDDDPTNAPIITEEEHAKYYITTGRILPQSDIYNRSGFAIQLKIPVEYPFKAPQIQMLTPIYHPNIGPEGKICIPMLRTANAWKNKPTLTDVINAVVEYIDKPNIDEAYSTDIAEEYLNNREDFNRKATELLERNMVSRD